MAHMDYFLSSQVISGPLNQLLRKIIREEPKMEIFMLIFWPLGVGKMKF